MADRLQQKIDALALFRRAESFYFTVHLLKQQHPDVFGQASFAVMTDAAFAVEAYMKVLAQLQRDEPPLDGHNLRDLFHDLAPETQKLARKIFYKSEGGPANMKKRARAAQKIMPSYLKQPQTFEESLDLSAKAFVEWRYNSTKPCFFGVWVLQSVMRDEILKIQPDWRPYKGHLLTVLNPHPDFAKPHDDEARKPRTVELNIEPATVNVRTGNRSNPADSSSGKRS